jgi:hypothetical protein
MKSLITFASELWMEMKKAPSIRQVTESHYTAKGIRAVIIDDYDGMKYEVLINPLYEREERKQ